MNLKIKINKLIVTSTDFRQKKKNKKRKMNNLLKYQCFPDRINEDEKIINNNNNSEMIKILLWTRIMILKI